MARSYAILPYAYKREMSALNDAEFGRLCRSLIDYSETGTPIALCGNERFYAERVMMQEDTYKESYVTIVERNRENGAKGGRPRENPEEPKETQANPDKPKKPRQTQKTQREREREYILSHARDAFDAWWAGYPKKVGKEAARKAFAKVKAPLDTLVAAVEAQKKSEQWQKENGRFIPNPATWLNQGRWEDELDTPITTAEASAPAEPAGMVKVMGEDGRTHWIPRG